MWKQHFIETTRGTFEYFTKGQGAPLAITHYFSHFDARGNLFANPFTEHYEVFLINVRGAGNSSPVTADEQMKFPEIIADLEAIREALGFEKWAFAGHSTGGMLALQYAVLAPHSLTKMIAGCTAASKAYASHPESMYCADNSNFARIIEIMELLNNPATTVEERQKYSYEWSLMSYYDEEKLKLALSLPNSGKTNGRALDYFRKVEVKSYDVRAALTNITIPSFIFGGRFDAQCPIEFTYEIAKLIPHAQLTVFEQSNHHPYIEELEHFEAFVKETIGIL
ncbi:alpha/beta hydrolase [Solibacillus sp. MA9]|uniref:Alpha/beta hydrolase n=1 Tax=Solibacillus palustris TaxID=2908203 RepID=A0ABS9UG62_9BACL|nr:alpha/beta fold hydrolase [Solibacillus sp. MA9]MCH7323356.1 alpha/beta hydrolase [Solibacillus sp. MA9]